MERQDRHALRHEQRKRSLHDRSSLMQFARSTVRLHGISREGSLGPRDGRGPSRWHSFKYALTHRADWNSKSVRAERGGSLWPPILRMAVWRQPAPPRCSRRWRASRHGATRRAVRTHRGHSSPAPSRRHVGRVWRNGGGAPASGHSVGERVGGLCGAGSLFSSPPVRENPTPSRGWRTGWRRCMTRLTRRFSIR